MGKKHVTLKVSLKRGTFYWVCDVDAASDEEAIVAAEHLFLSETGTSKDWQFNEFEVQSIDRSDRD